MNVTTPIVRFGLGARDRISVTADAIPSANTTTIASRRHGPATLHDALPLATYSRVVATMYTNRVIPDSSSFAVLDSIRSIIRRTPRYGNKQGSGWSLHGQESALCHLPRTSRSASTATSVVRDFNTFRMLWSCYQARAQRCGVAVSGGEFGAGGFAGEETIA